MRRLPLIVVAIAIAVAVSCMRTINVEQEEEALLVADAAWSETAKAKDVDKFMSYFAPDATLMFQGTPALSGQQAIRDNVGAMMKTPGFEVSWKATRAEVAASGDIGYTVGHYSMTAPNAAGVPSTENGKFVATWKKVDGAWKVVEDIGNTDAPTPISSAHMVMLASAVKWTDPPPSVPPGARLAAISGDPTKPEPFTIRLQLPAGYKIAPHWHPTDEHITVLSGTFSAGMGKAFDQKALADLPAGSYAVMSATMPHYAVAKTATTLQVHGMGPFVLNYVNPADDPSKK